MKPNLRQIKSRCHVDPETGCWLWGNCLQENGFGRISVDGKSMYVNRYVYELVHGEIPKTRPNVSPSCGDRRCCSPEHLEAKTRLGIMRTARDNGRLSRGRAHALVTTPHARRRADTKLTIEAAREIRERLAAGEPPADIAARFSISPSNVSLIGRGKAWRDTSIFSL